MEEAYCGVGCCSCSRYSDEHEDKDKDEILCGLAFIPFITKKRSAVMVVVNISP